MVQVDGVQQHGKESKKQRASDKKERLDNVAFKGYVNVSLTEAEKRRFVAWLNDRDLYANALVAAIRSGHKLSIDFQAREDAFRASLYCQNANLPQAGYCLSIFASEHGRAIEKLLYIHAEVLGGDWSKHLKRSLVDDSW